MTSPEPPLRPLGVRPRYDEAQLGSLTIRGVFLYEDVLICSLSDGCFLSVPLSLAPALQSAPRSERLQWRITENGRALAWHSTCLDLSLSLRTMLADPRATVFDPIIDLAGGTTRVDDGGTARSIP